MVVAEDDEEKPLVESDDFESEQPFDMERAALLRRGCGGVQPKYKYRKEAQNVLATLPDGTILPFHREKIGESERRRRCSAARSGAADANLDADAQGRFCATSAMKTW